jgi:hypothetical protein
MWNWSTGSPYKWVDRPSGSAGVGQSGLAPHTSRWTGSQESSASSSFFKTNLLQQSPNAGEKGKREKDKREKGKREKGKRASMTSTESTPTTTTTQARRGFLEPRNEWWRRNVLHKENKLHASADMNEEERVRYSSAIRLLNEKFGPFLKQLLAFYKGGIPEVQKNAEVIEKHLSPSYLDTPQIVHADGMKYLNRLAYGLILLYYNTEVSKLHNKFFKVLKEEISARETLISSMKEAGLEGTTWRENALSSVRTALKVLTTNPSLMHCDAMGYLPKLRRFLAYIAENRTGEPEIKRAKIEHLKVAETRSSTSSYKARASLKALLKVAADERKFLKTST